MKSISLKEISRLAGVSSSTVSLILNGKARQVRISEKLEKKVIAIAKKAGYSPNQLAISLRTGKSNILGLIVESISGHFFASLARVIEDEADKYGYRVVYCSTENDGIKGSELIRMLSHRQVDGYLITPVKGMEQEISLLATMGKPLVLIDSYFPEINVPAVMVDNYGGVKKGMTHLLKKGFKKIAYITIDLDLEQMKLREKAYRDALTEAGIRFNRKYELKVPYTPEKDILIEKIRDFLINLKNPDAVFFATNYLGIAGLESCRRAGIRIPEDLALVSFDDEDLFRLYPPGITSIQQPVEAIAKTAIELLIRQIGTGNKKPRPSVILLPPRLIVRGSTMDP